MESVGIEVPKFSHRKHLESIRGLACLLVILFHCDLVSFSNGYLGVDVFFVLSGYLITSILLRELASKGEIHFTQFYCRRFTRLFPASAVVISLTAVIYKNTELPEYAMKHEDSFIASALYGENWYALKVAMDYFTDKGSDQSPVVHFWSLSIEEQFYFVYPLFLSFVWSISQTNRLFRLLITFIMFLVLAIGINFYMWHIDPMVSYFSTFGRFYQLLSGSVLAIMLLIRDVSKNSKPLSRFVPFADYFAGLTLIIFVFVIYFCRSIDAFYMGQVTVILSFSLIFWLELSNNENNLIQVYLFENEFLCFMGKLSYGMYLTHVPIAKIMDIFSLLSLEGSLRGAEIVSVTFIAALIIFYLVERPSKDALNNWKLKPVWKLIGFACLSILQAVFICLIFSNSGYLIKNHPLKIKNQKSVCDNFRKLGSVFLNGDSYTHAWADVFLETHKICNISAKYTFIKSPGAPYLTVIEKVANYNDGYQTFRLQSEDFLRNEEPNVTLFFSRSILSQPKLWYSNYSGIGAKSKENEWKILISEAFSEFLPRTLNHTTGIFMIEHPHPKINPMKCIKRLQNVYGTDWKNRSNECKIELVYDRGIVFLKTLFERFKKEYKNFFYIELGPLLLGNKSNYFVVDAVLDDDIVYGDETHITKEFARKQQHLLLSAITRLIG